MPWWQALFPRSLNSQPQERSPWKIRAKNQAARQATQQEEDHIAAGSNEAEPFVLEVSDVLDLHTFAPSELPIVVETYLTEARAKGFATVRIIHGKGIGVQRERVRSILSRTAFVAHFEDAPMEAGSWGATVVWFRKESGEGKLL